MHIEVTVQTMNLPEDIRRSIERACNGKKPRSRVEFDDVVIYYNGPRCPRDKHGIPSNNLEIGLPVTDIDDGRGLPTWMKGVPHSVELEEKTSQDVTNGRYRYGGARGEVNSWQDQTGYNPIVDYTKIRINAKGKYAYKQALALYGKIRTGELVKQYHRDQAAGKRNHNVVELWG